MADSTQFTSGARSGGASGSVRTGDTDGGNGPGRVIEDAKNMGTQIIDTVRETATSLVDDQRNRAADQIAAMADMLRNSVQSLDRQTAGEICQYAEDGARQINDFADRLRNRSWSELADDAENFARRWPAVFMASAIAAGFIAGRFMISSASRPAETQAPLQPAPQSTTIADEPRGGARYDYGAVSGPVSGSSRSGYGTGGTGETP